MKKTLAVLLTVLMLGTLLAGCSQSSGGKGFELAVNVGPEPDTIDPAYNSAVDGATLIIHAFEGLMTLDKDGTPVEGQAESYEVSDDGLTYTFKLRDGLKWSDGSKLTAEDFVYSWKRAAATETAADYGYMFESIEGYPDNLNVTAPDEKTVVVKLIAPTPYFLELVAFPTYYPVKKDVVEGSVVDGTETWATDPKTYIGNGPYKMVEWTHDSEIIMEKNKNYYNHKDLGPDKIRFVLMSDDVAIQSAFQNGEILFADSFPNDEIPAWREKPEFNIQGQLGTYYISFNTARAPFDNPKVREAFSLAIDRQYIVDEIGQAGQQPAGAYVPTGLSDADPEKEFRDVGGNYYDPTGAGYEANKEKAKQLLAEAGYPNGEGFPTIEYLYNESTGHQLIGEALQQMWKDVLNVNITLASQEWNTFLNTRKNGDYFIARNGWLGDYNDPISFLDMWISTSGNNDAQYNNPEYDAIIKEVKTTEDREVRYAKMHEAEDILMNEAVVAPIYFYVDLYLKATNLEGFYSSPLGYKYFMYTSLAESK
jgi:oligopeptide transport system substrate-binding protein